jgi:hypothetical protein
MSEGLVDQRPMPLPDGPMAPLGLALALAQREIEPRVQAGRRLREEASRRRVDVELARLRDYFDENLRDLAANVRLRSDAFSSAPVEVVYDSVEEAVLPPACPGCGRPTTEWRLSPPPIGARDREGLAVCRSCHDRDAQTRARRR